MPIPQQYKARASLANVSVNSRSSIVPNSGELLWKPLKYGVEYTTSAYGILKFLIIGMSLAAFICLMITTGGSVHAGRYACFFLSTSVTLIAYSAIFAMSRFRIWDPKKPSLPHQIERLCGFILAVWNFISAGLVTPTARYHIDVHTRDKDLTANSPEWHDTEARNYCSTLMEICLAQTKTAAGIAFLLSGTVLVNFFLSVWWGPPLRYSMRLKNITEGDKYENFSNEPDTIGELQEP